MLPDRQAAPTLGELPARRVDPPLVPPIALRRSSSRRSRPERRCRPVPPFRPDLELPDALDDKDALQAPEQQVILGV